MYVVRYDLDIHAGFRYYSYIINAQYQLPRALFIFLQLTQSVGELFEHHLSLPQFILGTAGD